MTTQLIHSLQPRPAKVIHNLTWEQLEEIDRSLEDFPGLKLIYLDGTLEIMPNREEDEDAKATMRILLEAYLLAKGIRFYSRGGLTLGDKGSADKKYPNVIPVKTGIHDRHSV